MELIITVIVLSFLFETMDSSAGMGFGTGLTPLLFLMGYNPLQVVPILLISEGVTGITAGLFHHEFENVKFKIKKPLNKSTKVMLIIALLGCFSIVLSVIIAYFAISFDTIVIKTYVGILVIIMGLIAIVRFKTNTYKYRPKLLMFFSFLAGFNKGIGAGGYGPVVMLGQIFSGIYEKTATAIVSLSEGFVSIVGVLSFLLISAYGVTIDYVLLPSIFTGGFIAALLSPYMVRVIPNKIWKVVIPIYAISMGIITIAKLII